MRVFAALLLLAGCDQVFDLTRPPDAMRLEDAGPPMRVTGTLVRMELRNDPSRHPALVGRPIDGETDLPMVTSFGEPIPVQWEPDSGTFTFDAPRPYEIRIGENEWQSSASTVKLQIVTFGRIDAAFANGVTLNTTLTGSPAGRYELVSTGVWSRQNLGSLPSGVPISIDWLLGPFFGTVPRLIDTTMSDALYLAAWNPTGPSGESVVAQLGLTNILMQDGMQSVPFAMTTATPAGCARVMPTTKGDLDRLHMIYSTFTDTASGGWEFDAVPFPERLGVVIPLPVATRSLADGNLPLEEVNYPTPYPGHEMVLSQESVVGRFLDGSRLIQQGLRYHQKVSSTLAPCETTATPPTVALPIDFKLAGAALDTDNKTIAIPNQSFAELTWKTDGGDADLYYVDLFEIPFGTGTGLTHLRRYTTSAPRLRIATSEFALNARYIVRVTAETPNSAAAAGDFTSHALPFGTAFAFSSTFTLVN